MNSIHKLTLHILAVNDDLLFIHFRNIEGYILQQLFQNRMQTPCADIFGLLNS